MKCAIIGKNLAETPASNAERLAVDRTIFVHINSK